MLLSGGDRGDWWRAYDCRFRQQLLLLEQAEFGRLDQALYTRTILASGAGGGQRTSQVLPAEGQRKAKRWKAAACFAWNDGRACAATPCRYVHSCSRCGGDHRKSACVPAVEGQHGPLGPL